MSALCITTCLSLARYFPAGAQSQGASDTATEPTAATLSATDLKCRLGVWFNQGLEYHNQHNTEGLEHAAGIYQKIISEAERNRFSDASILAPIYMTLGNAYSELKRLPDAEKAYSKAIDMLSHCKPVDHIALAATLISYGTGLADNTEPLPALKEYSEALAQLDQVDNPQETTTRRTDCMRRMADVYAASKQNDKAQHYYKEALAANKISGARDSLPAAMAAVGLGKMCLEAKQLPEAEEQFFAALAIQKHRGTEAAAVETTALIDKLADRYLQTGRESEALRLRARLKSAWNSGQ